MSLDLSQQRPKNGSGEKERKASLSLPERSEGSIHGAGRGIQHPSSQASDVVLPTSSTGPSNRFRSKFDRVTRHQPALIVPPPAMQEIGLRRASERNQIRRYRSESSLSDHAELLPDSASTPFESWHPSDETHEAVLSEDRLAEIHYLPSNARATTQHYRRMLEAGKNTLIDPVSAYTQLEARFEALLQDKGEEDVNISILESHIQKYQKHHTALVRQYISREKECEHLRDAYADAEAKIGVLYDENFDLCQLVKREQSRTSVLESTWNSKASISTGNSALEQDHVKADLLKLKSEIRSLETVKLTLENDQDATAQVLIDAVTQMEMFMAEMMTSFHDSTALGLRKQFKTDVQLRRPLMPSSKFLRPALFDLAESLPGSPRNSKQPDPSLAELGTITQGGFELNDTKFGSFSKTGARVTSRKLGKMPGNEDSRVHIVSDNEPIPYLVSKSDSETEPDRDIQVQALPLPLLPLHVERESQYTHAEDSGSDKVLVFDNFPSDLRRTDIPSLVSSRSHLPSIPEDKPLRTPLLPSDMSSTASSSDFQAVGEPKVTLLQRSDRSLLRPSEFAKLWSLPERLVMKPSESMARLGHGQALHDSLGLEKMPTQTDQAPQLIANSAKENASSHQSLLGPQSHIVDVLDWRGQIASRTSIWQETSDTSITFAKAAGNAKSTSSQAESQKELIPERGPVKHQVSFSSDSGRSSISQISPKTKIPRRKPAWTTLPFSISPNGAEDLMVKANSGNPTLTSSSSFLRTQPLESRTGRSHAIIGQGSQELSVDGESKSDMPNVPGFVHQHTAEPNISQRTQQSRSHGTFENDDHYHRTDTASLQVQPIPANLTGQNAVFPKRPLGIAVLAKSSTSSSGDDEKLIGEIESLLGRFGRESVTHLLSSRLSFSASDPAADIDGLGSTKPLDAAQAAERSSESQGSPQADNYPREAVRQGQAASLHKAIATEAAFTTSGSHMVDAVLEEGRPVRHIESSTLSLTRLDIAMGEHRPLKTTTSPSHQPDPNMEGDRIESRSSVSSAISLFTAISSLSAGNEQYRANSIMLSYLRRLSQFVVASIQLQWSILYRFVLRHFHAKVIYPQRRRGWTVCVFKFAKHTFPTIDLTYFAVFAAVLEALLTFVYQFLALIPSTAEFGVKPIQNRFSRYSVAQIVSLGGWLSMLWLLCATYSLKMQWERGNSVRARREVPTWNGEQWMVKPAAYLESTMIRVLGRYIEPISDFT